MPWIDSQKVVRDNEPTEQEIQQVEEFARRKAKPRFYADEDFPTLAVAELRNLKAHVLTVQANRARGHPDENHVVAALRLGRILITCDRDYLDERRFPLIHCPAIVVCDFGAATLAEIRQTFRCIGPSSLHPNSSTNGGKSTLSEIAGQCMPDISTELLRGPDTDFPTDRCRNGLTSVRCLMEIISFN